MRGLFLGKPLHWLLIVAIVALLYWFGATQFHRMDYPGFLFSMLGLSAAAVAIVVATSRRGDRITREPLDDDS